MVPPHGGRNIFLWLGPLLLSACVLPRQPIAGCLSDRDCKLERICESGRCVWPAHDARRTAPPRTSTALPAPEAPKPSAESRPASTAQAMFRLGPEHRGRSPYRLPLHQPQVAWTYETRAPITASAAVTSDGLVAVGSHDGRLHIVDKDGTPRALQASSDLIFSSAAISASGILYFGSDDDHLYAFDLKQMKMQWRFQVGSCPQAVGVSPAASRCDVDAGPTIGPDGTLYTGGDGIYAINPDGTLRWRFATGAHVSSTPALMADGTVVAGCQDNLVYAVGPDGGKRWDFRAGDDIESSPMVAEDGTIYVGSDDGKLYALNPDGSLRWAFTARDDIRASPALGENGLILVGSFDGLFYAIKPDGTLAWTFRTGDRILSSALVDAAGAILFGSQDDRLYALESDGRPRWSVALGGDVDSSPVLGPDGTIYVGADDRKLYALAPTEH